ncbi:tryptophan synthase beta subunit-like PLP-dependent enzyme [Hyaloraphidium curvatum]|nr:tryptophan synthase beta subunit-like PLP-dependent enzyme [Hyaloraphidium curvatum]
MILTAPVYDVAMESPLTHAVNLSTRFGNNLYLKREDLQPVFSFKLRGAYNRMSQLTPEERKRGVVCASAGNHAQGVALAAKKMGIEATIVMPLATPPIKVKNVERLGGKAVLYGMDFDEAKKRRQQLIDEQGLVDVHPYDDPFVIAGQGTIAMEIVRQLPAYATLASLDAVFACVGGGGLLTGIASYIKRVAPHVKVIGVETYDADAMTRSLQAGKRVELPEVGLFADGAAVRLVGEETFRIAQELVDAMVLVSTDEVCAAIKDIFEDTRSIVEPAGALSVAGFKKYVQIKGLTGGTYVAIASGANINFDRLRFVSERAELGEKREALVSVVIPEKPGSFMTLYKAIAPRNVTEFAYRFSDSEKANIFMSFSLQTRDRETELGAIFAELAKKDMHGTDISDNETAKAHVRYLMGGRAKLPDERLFRFSFPDRPGALQRFLAVMKPTWNVSLFHYRNYGADVGKVLVGMQVGQTDADREEFEAFLRELRYPYVEETENEVGSIAD